MLITDIAREIAKNVRSAYECGENGIAEDLERIRLQLAGVGVAHFGYTFADFDLEQRDALVQEEQ